MGKIRRYDLIGGDVTSFKVSKPKPFPVSVLSCLRDLSSLHHPKLMDQTQAPVQLSSSRPAVLPAGHDGDGLALTNHEPQSQSFLLSAAFVVVSLHSNRKDTNLGI